jgi:peptide/nickel transport system permease protein
MFWQRMLSHKVGMIGLVLIVAILIIALLAPWIATHDPLKVDVANREAQPSAEYLFGTDDFGRDIFSRVIYGTRISLYISCLSVLLATIFGVIIGGISGYYSGITDNLIMRFMDAVMAFPAILLAIGIMAVLGPQMINVVLALGFVYIPRFARIMRGSVLSLKEQEFVQAVRSIGGTHLRILTFHIFPNTIPPIIVYATLGMGTAVLQAAALGFLGLGAQPPTPEWGAMLSEGRQYIQMAPHVAAFPGLAIFTLVLGFNLFGDGLRDVLDPSLR